jgi:hypothetical protein
MRDTIMPLLYILLLVAVVAVAGVGVGAAATPPPSAVTCLRWSAPTDTHNPGVASLGGFCRSVSLDQTPAAISIGKAEMVAGARHCFFPAQYPSGVSTTDPRHNGTSTFGHFQQPEESEGCVVNFTAAISAVPSNAVVGGFEADGSLLGLCVAPWAGSGAVEIPGQLYMSGPRGGQCCFNLGYYQHCASSGFSVAVFFPKAATPQQHQQPDQKLQQRALAPMVPRDVTLYKNASATTCLIWSTDIATSLFNPVSQYQGVCRSVVFANRPPSISIGKLEVHPAGSSGDCYFAELNYSGAKASAGGAGAGNGSSLPEPGMPTAIEIASVSPACKVNFSSAAVGAAHRRRYGAVGSTDFSPHNAVVAGFQADGSKLGVCVALDGAIYPYPCVHPS